MIRLAAGLAALVLSLFFPTTAAVELVKLGEVLLFTVPDLLPDADAKAFAQRLERIAPKRPEPGVAVHLFRGDRGSHKGQHALVWSVDTLTRRGERAVVPERVAKNNPVNQSHCHD